MKKLIPILLAACLLAGCAPEETPAPLNDFQRFSAEVNGARKSTLEAGVIPDLSAALVERPEELAPEATLNLDYPYADMLTKEQAAEDVEALFQLLRSAYAGYDYFGGDETFFPVKEAALTALDGEITFQRFSEVLRTALSPILQDGHFRLNSYPLIADKALYMYYVPDLYLPDPTGPSADYIKPTIGPDGAIAYCFAALSHDGRDLPTMAVVEGERISLTWAAAEALPEQGGPAYTRDEAAGVPILINRSMGAVDPALYQQQYEALRAFSDSGQAWAGEPLFLLDIRGNTGGSPYFSRAWLKGLTGQSPQPWRVDALRNSSAVEQDEVLPSFYQSMELDPASPGTWTVNTQTGRWTENDNLVFALLDKTTVSAAEFFIRDLRTLDNVIFVGSNTYGGALAGGIRTFQLPNSGVYLSFGTMLSLAEDGANIDGTGYLPDLWVNPVDAQDAVLRLINYYSLK